MRLVVAMLAVALSLPAFAQEKKAEKRKPVAKKVEKKPAAKKADSSSDWSQFQGSAKRDLKADEEKRKAKAAKK